MAEQTKQPRETTDIIEQIKEVWEQKEYKPGKTIQKIIFVKGPALNLWDCPNFDKSVEGKILTATDVYSKPNKKNYPEYNTTDQTILEVSDAKAGQSSILKTGSKTDGILKCPHCNHDIIIQLTSQ